MKTKILLALILAVALLLSLCLFGCNTPTDTEGEVTVVIGTEGNYAEYKISLSDVEITEGVLSLAKYLSENEGVSLDYADSIYGAYVNIIGDLEPDGMAGEYVTVLTSVEADFDVGVMFSSLEYKGITLGSSGVGVSTMKVENGATYLFTIATYSF